jgi:hypothetical protein
MTTAAPPAEALRRVRVVIGCDRFGCTAQSGAWYRLPRSMPLADRYDLHRAHIARRYGWHQNASGDDLCPKHRNDEYETPEVTE